MAGHRVWFSGEVAVVEVSEERGRAPFQGLVRLCNELVHQSWVNILLDMAKLSFTTSEQIGFLVLIHDDCQKGGGQLALCRLQPRLQQVLEMATLSTFFKVYPDVPAALAAFAEAAAGPRVPAEGAASSPAPPAPLATAAPPQPPPTAQEEENELARLVRQVITTMIPSRHHYRLLEQITSHPLKTVMLIQAAQHLRLPPAPTSQVIDDLVRAGFLTRSGDAVFYSPSPQAEEAFRVFSAAMHRPRLRPRLVAWLHAEDKQKTSPPGSAPPPTG